MTPANGPDPADIVALRDGEPLAAIVREAIARNPEAALALADARLLSLAIGLPRGSDPERPWALPPDDELVSYLVGALEPAESAKLESGLRGNPRAFARLVELRNVLAEKTSVPSKPWRPVGASDDRMRLGTVWFRRADKVLQFRRDSERLLEEDFGADLAADVSFLDQRASRRDFEGFLESLRIPSLSRRDPKWAIAALDRLRTVEEQLDESLESVRSSLRSLRTSIESIVEDRGKGPDARIIEMRLARLEEAIWQASMQLRLIDPKGTGRLPGRPRPSFRRAPPLPEETSFALGRMEIEPSEPRWTNAVDFAVPSASFALSGTVARETALNVEVRHDDGSAWAKALVTIAQARQGFSSVESGPDGKCSLRLPSTRSTLLVETDRTLEVELRPAGR
jgi:hypothetical protein